ncbi:hypothetical protein T492DRAFT_978492, partial [Pavlovales sp. CCMP2436]
MAVVGERRDDRSRRRDCGDVWCGKQRERAAAMGHAGGVRQRREDWVAAHRQRKGHRTVHRRLGLLDRAQVVTPEPTRDHACPEGGELDGYVEHLRLARLPRVAAHGAEVDGVERVLRVRARLPADGPDSEKTVRALRVAERGLILLVGLARARHACAARVDVEEALPAQGHAVRRVAGPALAVAERASGIGILTLRHAAAPAQAPSARVGLLPARALHLIRLRQAVDEHLHQLVRLRVLFEDGV